MLPLLFHQRLAHGTNGRPPEKRTARVLRYFLDPNKPTAPSQIKENIRFVCDVIRRYHEVYQVLEVDERKTQGDTHRRTFYKVRKDRLEDLQKEIDAIEQVHDEKAAYNKENQTRERKKWKESCLSDKEIESLCILEAQDWKIEKKMFPMFKETRKTWNEWYLKMKRLCFIKTEGSYIEVTDDGRKFFKERLDKLRGLLGC